MLPKSDSTVVASDVHDENGSEEEHGQTMLQSKLSRKSYAGTLIINICAFMLPALYSTLSKLWVANIDSSRVVTTDVYTYIGVVAEVINEGLPRAAWNIIGDKSNRPLSQRYSLSLTLIAVQAVLGLILSVIFVGAAPQFANTFVPETVREASLTYVRISAFSTFSSAIQTAVAACTRALDRPDVPLIISSATFAINIVLDLLIISKFHVGSFEPTVNMQAGNQLVCNIVAAIIGLVYFLYGVIKDHRASQIMSEASGPIQPTFAGLVILIRPGWMTFLESAVRNALYLWLVNGIVALGSDYATAWGVFNTIRWGLIMVPVQALEATSLAFVGHIWGQWRTVVGSQNRRPRATSRQVRDITKPALVSCIVALTVEIPLCIFLAEFGAQPFAFYLSESIPVANIVRKMWKTIDWCYIFYALSTQLATILLATRPRWYLYQSLVSNLFWVLPWAIVVSKIGITESDAWTYHSIVFGGSLVFSFFDVLLFDAVWFWTLLKGRMDLPPLTGALKVERGLGVVA